MVPMTTIKLKYENEHNWENSTKSKCKIFLINDQNIMFGYPPLWKNSKIEKSQSINIDECLEFFIEPFLLREYNSFSQNSESSLEQ